MPLRTGSEGEKPSGVTPGGAVLGQSTGGLPPTSSEASVGLYDPGPQSPASGSAVACIFDDADQWDTENMHDPVTNNTRVTIRTAGVYVWTAEAQFDPNATGERTVDVIKSGAVQMSATKSANTGAGGIVIVVSSGMGKLAVGDYLEMRVTQTSGGALACGGFYFRVSRVSAG